MLKVLAVSGVFASLLAAPTTANAAPTSPIDHVSVDVVSVNGSGCANGRAYAATSSDGTEITVTGAGFVARSGPEALPGDFRKNCQISLRVDVPEGFTYAIAEAEYWGIADLADGASATEQTSYYFQGMSRTARMSTILEGPTARVWQQRHVLESDSLIYAPCGGQRNLNINTEVRMNRGMSDPSATSIITRGLPSFDTTSVYRLAWKPCH